MSPLLPTASSFVRGALRRLPVETALVSAAAFTLIWLLHAHTATTAWPARVLLTSLIGLPLAFALHEHPRTAGRAGRLGAAVVALVALAMLAVIRDDDSLDRAGVLWPLLLVTAAAYLVPFVVAAPRFSAFVRRFFEEVTTAVLLGGVAVAAILTAAYAIDTLFDQRCFELGGDAALLTAAAFTLLVLDRLRPDRAATGKVPELWRRLATAIGAPFVCVMLAILIVYELTVIFRGELPGNTLSPLLIGAGFVGYLCTLIITAVAAEPVGSGALAPADPHRFLRDRSVQLARAFPIALLLLLPMALWAVLVRIEQYGLTPFRVVRLAAVLCLMALSVLGTLRWLRGRAPLSWHVPAVVGGFALLVAVGPQSAVNLSIRSQAARFAQLLDDAGVDTRAVASAAPASPRRLPYAQWAELERALDELADLGGEAAIRRVLTGAVQPCAQRWSTGDCLLGLGVALDSDREPAAVQHHYYTRRTEEPVAIPAGEVTFVSAGRDEARHGVDERRLRLACGSAGDDEAGWAVASLEPYFTEEMPRPALPPRAIPLTGEGGCQRPGVFLLRSLDAVSAEGAHELRGVEGIWVR